jgi:hypothetical protein
MPTPIRASSASKALHATRRSKPSLRCLLPALAALAASFGSASAKAMSACVNNTAQLALVLAAAGDNGEDDVIRVEVGTYLLDAELDYFPGADETEDIAIYGGYASGCFQMATSGSTVLDGQDASRVMYIIGRGRVTVSGLVIQNGHVDAQSGGGLVVSGGANSIAAVDYNIFLSNECPATNGGAAVEIGADTILMRNNLFVGNAGGSTIYLINNAFADVNNNTIVGNLLANHAGLGAFDPTGSGQYYVNNNILWGNEGNDVYDQSGLVTYYNNDIGVRDGFPPQFEAGGLSVDPGFDGFLSVRPKPTSPLVNAGYDSPYGGFGTLDLGGDPRLTGTHVDIGAYESDVLLRDGFDP